MCPTNVSFLLMSKSQEEKLRACNVFLNRSFGYSMYSPLVWNSHLPTRLWCHVHVSSLPDPNGLAFIVHDAGKAIYLEEAVTLMGIFIVLKNYILDMCLQWNMQPSIISKAWTPPQLSVAVLNINSCRTRWGTPGTHPVLPRNWLGLCTWVLALPARLLKTELKMLRQTEPVTASLLTNKPDRINSLKKNKTDPCF